MASWVMIVDDEEMNLQMAGKLLSDYNMRVTAVKSGRAMLNYIKEKGTPDLILLDINMPEMDGFETLAILRKYEKELGLVETPVIFLTANENPDAQVQGFKEGVADYICKPFDPDIFVMRVCNAITIQSALVGLKEEATIDKLTGVLNREAANVEFSQFCIEKRGCLMVLDIDSFMTINDTYNREMGDKVLAAFAEIIKSTFPMGSRFGRIGGDKFVVFARGIVEEQEVEALSKTLNEQLVAKAKEILGPDEKIPLGVSIGAIMVPKLGNDYQSLFRLADKTLRNVKKNCKHGYKIYSSATMLEDEKDSIVPDMQEITEIIGENNVSNVAMQLDMESFSYAYRYATRYFIRNSQNFCKVLFNLEKTDRIDDVQFKNLTDDFGYYLRESLRKSDMLTRSRFNQYFVLLTDIEEENVAGVLDQILGGWDDKYDFSLNINYVIDYVRNDGSFEEEGSGANIVIVDDDMLSLRVSGEVLRPICGTLTEFHSGAEFLNFVQTEEMLPDLILLDIKLPGVSGFDVMNQLHDMGGEISNVPIILMTAADDGEELEAEGLSLGAIDYIRKPLLPEIMKARVQRVLELMRLKKKYEK